MKAMFEDPNRTATACQKLSDLKQGGGSVEVIIQKFELYGPTSGLGDVGLIDKFKHMIVPCLCQAIYSSVPFPTTWEEWKRKVSLLDSQHKRFVYTQSQMCQNRPSSSPSNLT
jgi:hypothetical protein